MRVKIIMNPSSDIGRGRRHLDLIRQTAAGLGEFDLVLTEGPGHAEDLAVEAVAAGYDVVAAAGGDGTVHDVVNGLFQAESHSASLGVVPIGSGNDFAFGLGILDDVETAVTRLFTGKPITLDLAQIKDDRGFTKVFENNLGIGFDANVVIRSQQITVVHGFLMYLLAVLKTLALDFRPIPLQMRFDAEEVSEEVLFLAFGLGPRHGGGFFLTPAAHNQDELVDTCLARPMSRLKALWMLNKAIKGTHVTSPLVTMRQSQQVNIVSSEPLPIHIDGEVFASPHDQVCQVTIRSLPAALTVVV